MGTCCCKLCEDPLQFPLQCSDVAAGEDLVDLHEDERFPVQCTETSQWWPIDHGSQYDVTRVPVRLRVDVVKQTLVIGSIITYSRCRSWNSTTCSLSFVTVHWMFLASVRRDTTAISLYSSSASLSSSALDHGESVTHFASTTATSLLYLPQGVLLSTIHVGIQRQRLNLPAPRRSWVTVLRRPLSSWIVYIHRQLPHWSRWCVGLLVDLPRTACARRRRQHPAGTRRRSERDRVLQPSGELRTDLTNAERHPRRLLQFDIVCTRSDLQSPTVDVLSWCLTDHCLLRWSPHCNWIALHFVYSRMLEFFRSRDLLASAVWDDRSYNDFECNSLTSLYDTTITEILDCQLLPSWSVTCCWRPSSVWFDFVL